MAGAPARVHALCGWPADQGICAGKLLPRPRPGKQGPPARDWRARLAIYTLYFAACVIGGRLIMQYCEAPPPRRLRRRRCGLD